MSNTAVSNKKIAVILPAYNEELTIAETIRAFREALPEAVIYVVNNNSRDRTREIAGQVLQELACPGRVIDEPRQGKGSALRRAFIEIDADIYVLADADLTYPAYQARELMAPVIEGRADMVVGDRRSNGDYARENQRSFHSFGNGLVQWMVNRLFHARLVDIMSGYRVFSRDFVKTYPVLAEGFQIETDMTLHALHKRMRIVEIPVSYKDRPAGSVSKLNTLSDGTRVLFAIAQIFRYYRPLAFFSVLSIIMLLLGFSAGIPVFDDWIQYRYIYHVPLAILATGLCIAAVMALGIGLILDSVAHQQRLEFELRWLSRSER
ncbi:Glycosyltransferase involved in cell wall bisynthesis [Collimonas sp. OK607]|uniref:glycosyltransferase family 2 protein n=1 Tax=Collimonas sp. OK607 TaxID=1798194 RepID=UPI0008F42209|nr:glycosyltransferase family 2 protein [Collimonas sp. OK607]SFB37400.1 Glycosyltransferase involved in cell wall bisynthesis [Collimonas sp. OK607]